MSNINQLNREPLPALFKGGLGLDAGAKRRVTIDWISVDERMPDADMAVMLDYDGESWPGVYDGERWFDLTGMPIVAQVLNWSEYPEVPNV